MYKCDEYIKSRNKSSLIDFLIKIILYINSYWIFHAGLRNRIYSMAGVNFIKGDNKIFIAREVLIDNDFPELVTIEEGAVIAWRAILICNNMLDENDCYLDRVHIKSKAVIGSGAIIMPGVTIGENAIVYPGSVVVEDVPDHALVSGNPAQIISR